MSTFEGLRACAQNGGAEYLTHEAPDILCLQVLLNICTRLVDMITVPAG